MNTHGSKLGVEVILETDEMSNHPFCPHGPTLLFERYCTNGKKSGQKFFACSAFRDRKACSFFLWADDLLAASSKQPSTENLKKEHRKMCKKNRKHWRDFRLVTQKERKFCNTCSLLLLPKEEKEHDTHDVQKLTKAQLRQPSHILSPLENSKKEAQFFFADKTVKFLASALKDLGFHKVLCIGTPRLHEYIRGNKLLGLTSLLLDIDSRYQQFGQHSFHYNLFNHYFFGGVNEERRYQDFLTADRARIVVVMDPPFGGLVDAIAFTLAKITNEWRNVAESQCASEALPLFWIFPYFMEQRILSSMSTLCMLDYKVNYENHPLFHRSSQGKKRGSPVRIFTNIPPSRIALPSDEGYRFCNACQRYIAAENRHCDICQACTSKDGNPWKHCNLCGHCVKSSRQHCNSCNSCQLPSHTCGTIPKQGACHLCGAVGHKRKECPEKEDSRRQRKKRRKLSATD